MLAIINTALIRAMEAAGDLKARLTKEHGQTLMEYAVLTGMIAVVAAGALSVFLVVGANPFDDMATAIANCVSFSGTCP